MPPAQDPLQSDHTMVGPLTIKPASIPQSKALQTFDATPPKEWLKLPLPQGSETPNHDEIQYVEYHLHFGKEARGWRHLQNFAQGRPALPKLREVRVIMDGSAVDRLTLAQCKDFHFAAELIGLVNFRCERVEVVYVPHHRSAHKERPGEPDEATHTRDELQDFVVRGVGKTMPFGNGKVLVWTENEVWPGREVKEGMGETMRMVYTRGQWE
jgi:hypothetical protein